MTTRIHETDRHRMISDDFSGRVFSEETRCTVCNEWVNDEDLVWVDPATGEASWRTGKPYCVSCAPDPDPDT